MSKAEFYINKNQYKTQDKHPSYVSKKVILTEPLQAGTYEVAAWGGSNQYGPYIKLVMETKQDAPVTNPQPDNNPVDDDIPF
tara:strand:+ start:110 stop:355 length:246 start_codon:yes stop_codon:yes gene_type:complete